MMKYRFTILGGLLIAALSLIPGNQLPETEIEFADLIVHVSMYGLWTFLVLRDFRKQYSSSDRRFISVIIMLLIAIYGGIMEVLQENFISGRFGSLADALANALGSIIGLLTFNFFVGKTQ